MQTRSNTLWYAVIGALALILVVALGVALWPKSEATEATTTPAASTTTDTPSEQPGEPSPEQDPSSEEPPPTEPTSEAPTSAETLPPDMPAPGTTQFDHELRVFGGFAPPVLFGPIFDGITDFDQGLPESLGDYKLMPENVHPALGGVVATYKNPDGEELALTIDDSLGTYQGLTTHGKNLHHVGVATCAEPAPRVPDCAVAATDGALRIVAHAPAGKEADEDVEGYLREAVTHYASRG